MNNQHNQNGQNNQQLEIGDKVKLLVLPNCIGEVMDIEKEIDKELNLIEILHLRSPQPHGHVVVDARNVKKLDEERFEMFIEQEERRSRNYFRGGYGVPPTIDKYL